MTIIECFLNCNFHQAQRSQRVTHLWLCWRPEPPNQEFLDNWDKKSTKTEKPAKKGKNPVKKEKKTVKAETKEPKPTFKKEPANLELPGTITGKREREAIMTAETISRKRPGIVTRIQQRALEARLLGSSSDEKEEEELELYKDEVVGSTGQIEGGYKSDNYGQEEGDTGEIGC